MRGVMRPDTAARHLLALAATLAAIQVERRDGRLWIGVPEGWAIEGSQPRKPRDSDDLPKVREGSCEPNARALRQTDRLTDHPAFPHSEPGSKSAPPRDASPDGESSATPTPPPGLSDCDPVEALVASEAQRAGIRCPDLRELARWRLALSQAHRDADPEVRDYVRLGWLEAAARADLCPSGYALCVAMERLDARDARRAETARREQAAQDAQERAIRRPEGGCPGPRPIAPPRGSGAGSRAPLTDSPAPDGVHPGAWEAATRLARALHWDDARREEEARAFAARHRAAHLPHLPAAVAAWLARDPDRIPGAMHGPRPRILAAYLERAVADARPRKPKPEPATAPEPETDAMRQPCQPVPAPPPVLPAAYRDSDDAERVRQACAPGHDNLLRYGLCAVRRNGDAVTLIVAGDPLAHTLRQRGGRSPRSWEPPAVDRLARCEAIVRAALGDGVRLAGIEAQSEPAQPEARQ